MAQEKLTQARAMGTILDCMRYWAAETPEQLAVETTDHGKLTYAELARNANALAAAFGALGLKTGDRVAIQLPSSPEFVTTYMACAISGCVLTTLHMPYRQEELHPLMAFAGVKAVVTAEVGKYDGPEVMEALKGEIGSLEHVISVTGPKIDGQHHFGALVADNLDAPEIEGAGPDAEVALCFTSGTSAAPKGVIRKQTLMAQNARRFGEMLSMTQDDRVMIAPPLTHVFGLLCAGNALMSGATIVPIPMFTPPTYGQYLTEMRPTVVYSAPAHLAATLKSGVMDASPPETVRDVIVGGSICPPEVAAQFEARLPNGRVGCLFGMTEALLATQTVVTDAPEIRHATVGQLAEGLTARIMTLEGEDVTKGGEGELQLSGYSILPEYLDNPDANASSFTGDGWFRTGDLASIDENGNIMITGRSKDIINRGGIKINPADIESILDGHADIVQSALVPMPDEVLGERICVYVALRPDTSLTLDDLCAYLDGQGVAKMRWPERLEVIPEMPMTPTKKIIKPVLVADIREKVAG
ncbi:class I adenylate-forming enzyme family protein [Roseovarius sp.]|uniref:class I adenylate-forming enzyme family protein n=1 Tax=Roseovarius sp. TaxID=1486281 RepID=UPI002607CBC0|nr:class I adenylate-forming enzyme family protein [Roseovarius sp.]MDM8164459.1 class I adenylate-forming enzyme family protein [Roseovarius sp.]